MENLKDLNSWMLLMLHVEAKDYPHRPSKSLSAYIYARSC